jgi:4-hydroxythreonine-4-phosphate dehydrogenase
MKKKIPIILGEPYSINTEIIAKSYKKANNNIKKKIFIIGNYSLFKNQLTRLKIKIPIKKIKSLDENSASNELRVLDVPLNFKNNYTIKDNDISKYIKNCFNLAHKLAIKKKIHGFINCPIDKKKTFRSQNIGVTEYLAKKDKLKNKEVMMIYNKKLSVVPITTHINIKFVSKKLSKDLIIKKIKTLNEFYYKLFKKKPHIAVLGLNPHNNELRNNSEERKIILPSIKQLKKIKIKVSGPFPADTIFTNVKKYKCNIIVGMYHDQVLAPFKAIYKYNAINITLGLKYIRVSPDHGTAKDLVGKGVANSSSLEDSIKFISTLKI